MKYLIVLRRVAPSFIFSAFSVRSDEEKKKRFLSLTRSSELLFFLLNLGHLHFCLFCLLKTFHNFSKLGVKAPCLEARPSQISLGLLTWARRERASLAGGGHLCSRNPHISLLLSQAAMTVCRRADRRGSCSLRSVFSELNTSICVTR